MCSCNKLQTVDVVELGRHLVSEQPACSSGRHGPCVDVLRVTPDEIAEGTFVGDFLCPRYDANLVQRADLGRQSTVHAEHLAVDNGCEGKEVEDLTTRLPDRGVAVLGLALLVEAVHLGDLSRLVVSTHQRHSVGESTPSVRYGWGRAYYILGLQAHQQRKGLQTEVAAVDKVAKEYEVLLAVANHRVSRRSGVRHGPGTPPVVDAPAAAPRLLLFIVTLHIVAVAARGAGGANVVWVALEPPLHLALDLGVCDAGGRLEVGGVDLAGQGHGRRLRGLWCVVGHASSDAEQLEEVVELAVDVSAHGDGRPDGLDV